MTARKTIKWFLLIVLVLGLAGGGYAYWVWSNANKLLLQNVRESIAEMAPGWDVEVGAARFDWHRRVHLYDVTLKSPDGSGEIVRIPEAVLVVDREKLAESQVVDIQRIRLIRPEWNLVRDAQGVWNYQKLPPLMKSKKKSPLPEVVIEEATVAVTLQQADGAKPAEFMLRDADLQLVPAASREFIIKGSTVVKQAGKLDVTGRLNVDNGTWQCDGAMRDIRADGEILSLAVGVSPELRNSVAEIEQTLRRLTPADERPKTQVNADAVPNFGASAIVDLNFHLKKTVEQSEPVFDIRSRFRQGRIENPVLPMTLNDLAGEVHWANDRFDVKKLTARSGSTRLEVDAFFVRSKVPVPCEIKVAVYDLPVDARIRKRLPADLAEVYDTTRPRGRTDVVGKLRLDEAGNWSHHNFVLSCKDASFSHVDFPYRFNAVRGKMTQLPDRWKIELSGLAGKQPAWLTGTILTGRKQDWSQYELKIRNFQLDKAFQAALDADVRETVQSLALTGQADVGVRATFIGDAKEPILELAARVKDSAIEYNEFPYRLNRLTGVIHYDSRTEVWTFSKLQAFNGPAEFSGSATLVEKDGKQQLALTVNGKGAYFDRPLYRALPKGLQGLWRELSPTGKIDLTVDLDWTEGSDAVITIPTCTISEATMTAKSFPFEFKNVTGKFAYASNVLRILSFTSKQEQSKVNADGFVRIWPDGEWRLRLVNFKADDLNPDTRFRKTLGPKLKAIFDEIDPRGAISCNGVLEFRGTDNENDTVTAAWDMKVGLKRNSINLGTKLTDVTGDIYVYGTWDGSIVDMRKGNRFDLDSATVHGYTFTKVRGPFRYHRNRLEIGSPQVFRPRKAGERPPRVDAKERLTAHAVGGTFTLDAVALFEKEPTYRILVTMDKARLERFARQYLNKARNLQGVMYGRIDLAGKGTSAKNMYGKGKLLISPAALYELPVLAQVFNVISFTPPDKTAFRFAFADFRVEDRQFQFDTIDLVGDSISLRGRGVADFEGRLGLDFYSMMPKARLPTDILKQLVGTATTGWIGVQVAGTAKNPRARVRAVPQLEDTLKAFLNNFGQPITGPRTLPASMRRTVPRRRRPGYYR